ncbi:Mitochondrial nuclease [Wickerhamomyces ciferrii]|uniref:Endonuclease n=1 Tax=Wickerhamomyces ciferrii (strain ATCC 14091 / BCRC 22168 / CBS 111 / JCM 3599 / NBRC 0793 / NRRL Y-1031 F-60-10) TaxID=1206466 RepID=K0KLT5_WICCF|nr:Mitochondrial nuclease [Wickerhamomyces ciferrii]CCH43177.1 Mitochondrial nuclease [Wickerhamomyces ciferrii]
MSKYLASGFIGAGTSAVIANFFWGRSSSSTTDTETSTNGATSYGGVPAAKGPSGGIVSGPVVNPAGFFKYGFPGPIHDLQNRQEYISCYDRQKRNPYWVLEHITPESIKSNGQVDRKKSVFKEDEKIPDTFKAKLKDYFRSGYDRGHQAPAANAKFNQEAMDETFYLSNISPQVGEGFNRDYWAHLEFFCRDLTKVYNNVRIVTGPLYLPKRQPDGKWRVSYEVIGNPPNVAVPTHFFKLIVAENPSKNPNDDSLSVTAFVLPNEEISNSTPLKSFEVPVEALERSSGLTLLQNVPQNKKKFLCREVDCSIIVREFNNALPPKKDMLLLPPPK